MPFSNNVQCKQIRGMVEGVSYGQEWVTENSGWVEGPLWTKASRRKLPASNRHGP